MIEESQSTTMANETRDNRREGKAESSPFRKAGDRTEYQANYYMQQKHAREPLKRLPTPPKLQAELDKVFAIDNKPDDVTYGAWVSRKFKAKMKSKEGFYRNTAGEYD